MYVVYDCVLTLTKIPAKNEIKTFSHAYIAVFFFSINFIYMKNKQKHIKLSQFRGKTLACIIITCDAFSIRIYMYLSERRVGSFKCYLKCVCS